MVVSSQLPTEQNKWISRNKNGAWGGKFNHKLNNWSIKFLNVKISNVKISIGGLFKREEKIGFTYISLAQPYFIYRIGCGQINLWGYVPSVSVWHEKEYFSSYEGHTLILYQALIMDQYSSAHWLLWMEYLCYINSMFYHMKSFLKVSHTKIVIQ